MITQKIKNEKYDFCLIEMGQPCGTILAHIVSTITIRVPHNIFYHYKDRVLVTSAHPLNVAKSTRVEHLENIQWLETRERLK